MSREEAEFVRRAFEAFAAGGVEAADDNLKWFHTDVEYREDPKWPGSRVLAGREAVKARFLEYREIMEPTAWVTEEVIDVGNAIVYVFRLEASTTGQGVPTEHRWAYLVRMRDGLIGSFHAYLDPDEALAAATRRA